MRVRLLGTALAALSVVAGGCGDDDRSTASDAGRFNDSGSDVDAARDAGPTADGGPGSDGGELDGGAATDAGTAARPLGTIEAVPGTTCGTGALSGAVCSTLTVRCPGIEEATARVAVAEPPAGATERGTIFTHSGGGGTGFYTTNLDALRAGGFRIVQVRWTSDWEATEGAGILEAACRPATVARWAFDEAHGARTDEAFCAVGHSGGSGVLSYALAHYGLESILDYVQLTAGPPFGRLDYGCAPDSYTGPPRTLCPELADAPVALPAARIDGWENTTTCGRPSPSASDMAKWARDSVVSDGADYDYPDTLVTFWDCATNSNGTAGGAYFYSREILSEHTVQCFTECSGEPLGTAGVMALRDAMLSDCSPRH